jgi:hypothetical protein
MIQIFQHFSACDHNLGSSGTRVPGFSVLLMAGHAFYAKLLPGRIRHEITVAGQRRIFTGFLCGLLDRPKSIFGG